MPYNHFVLIAALKPRMNTNIYIYNNENIKTYLDVDEHIRT